MWPTLFPAHAAFFFSRPGGRCWREADILSATMHAGIDKEVGRTTVAGKDGGVDELQGLVLRMSVAAKGGDVEDDIREALTGMKLSPGANPTSATMEAVDRWLSVEESEEVSQAIVADMVDDLCDEHVVEMDSDDDVEMDAAEQGEAAQQSSAAAAPPYARVSDHFSELEGIAEKCSMSEVSYHLRKAKLAWMSAHGSRAAKQTIMQDYL